MNPTTPNNTPSTSFAIADLETVYDQLAEAIDHAGPDHDKLFLVKLALLCARRIGSADAFEQDIRDALRDLPGR